MANPWFRMYAEFLHDPKVRVMSDIDQLRLVLLFCLRCGNDKPLKDEHISFSLRISADEWKQTKATFIDCGFLTNKNELANWDKRQFLSDSSADRVKKYRSNRKDLGLSSNGYTKHSVTVMSRDGNCCVYCGSKNNLCIDHILPTQQGGNDDLENLAAACKACNSGKAGRTPEQARYSFMNKQTEAIWQSWLSRRVTVTVTPPEQNRTEQIQNRTDINASSSPAEKPPKSDAIPYEKIVNLYHEKLPELPKVAMLTTKRRGQIGARWKSGNLPDLETWSEYFDFIKQSDFLMGMTDPVNGHKRFKADLEWLTTESNYTKICERKYHGKR